MDKTTLTKLTTIPLPTIITFSSAILTGLLIGISYQFIVFEYTTEKGIVGYHDLSKYIIIIISGLALMANIFSIYHSIKSKNIAASAFPILFMIPIVILLTYVIHSNISSGDNEKYYEFARKFSHIYSGLFLILSGIYIIITILCTLLLAFNKKKNNFKR